MSPHKYYPIDSPLAATPPNPQQEALALVLTVCIGLVYASLSLTS